jgi:hypothetical protein
MWPRRAERRDQVGAAPAADPEPRPAWGSVAAMQRTFDPPTMTMETFSFQAGLAAHTNPELLRPLDHGRSAGAPAGVIDGLLTPVLGPARAVGGGAELPLPRSRPSLRLQRRPATMVATYAPPAAPPAASPEALEQEPARALPALPERQSAEAPALMVAPPRTDLPALRLPAVTTVQRADDEAVPPGEEQEEPAAVDVAGDTTQARTLPVATLAADH